MKFLLIVFLFPLQLFAQDITGVWTGSLYNDTTKQFIHYELAVSEYNAQLSGYSHTTFIIDSVKNIGVKSVKIKKKDDQFSVEDDKLIYNNYPEPPAKGVKTFVTLNFSENDTAQILTGIWHTNRTKVFSQLTGTISLERKKKIRETLIVAKLDQMGLTPKLSFASSLQNGENNQKLMVSTNAVSSKAGVGPNVSGTNLGATETNAVNLEEKNNKSNSAISNEESFANKTTENSSTNKLIGRNAEKESRKKSANPVKKADASRENESSGNQKALSQETAVFIKGPQQNIQKEVIKMPAAAEIKTRQIETIQTVEIAQDSLVLTLYDNGTVDGDTVSVLINGKVVWPRVGLLATATNKTIHLDHSDGDSLIVVMYAENLGSIAPNTGLLVVRDGDKNYEIRFSGDLQKNSAIILKRKKKP